MAEKVTPVGTEKMPDNPALVNLREREKALSDKLAYLNTANALDHARVGHDLNAAKDRAKRDLAEIRKAIKDLTK